MEKQDLNSAIEALLFASGDPLSVSRIAEVLNLTQAQAQKAAEDTMTDFNTHQGGIKILQLEDSFQMCSRPEFAPQIRSLLEIRRNTPLSQAAMEVLAIISYNQPVTKAFVEQIRGVDCSGVLGSLMQKGLIEERGRLELPGRPLLYGTTSTFLRCFGISSLEELPSVQKETEDNATEPVEESQLDELEMKSGETI